MRHAYAHEAVLMMSQEADLRAPGAAITVALCGHWDHQPPCPLAAHHTTVARAGDRVHLRTLFAAEPEAEQLVRRRIEDALWGGHLQGPDGVITRWQLHSSQRSEVTADEASFAERMGRS